MTHNPISQSVQILLVDDDPADVKLARRALRLGPFIDQVHVARDGVEALQFLRCEGRFADAPRPDLVFLDLNMPRMGGRQVLGEIKSDDDLKAIPVVILSTSDSDMDIAASFLAQANAYITKPADNEEFNSALLSAVERWCTGAEPAVANS